MGEWKTYRLGDLCDSISNTYRGKAQNVVLINTSDVLEGKCLNHRKEPNKNLKGQFKKTFQQGDILYSEIRPSNKRFAYIDFDATDYIASTKLMVLRANEKIRPLYLYYILQSQVVIDELQMLAESRSGTFPQITFSELSLLTTELPDIDSQDKIINILKSLDDKIELNRRINANLEAQAQALFRSWFVDFEPNPPRLESRRYLYLYGRNIWCPLQIRLIQYRQKRVSVNSNQRFENILAPILHRRNLAEYRICRFRRYSCRDGCGICALHLERRKRIIESASV